MDQEREMIEKVARALADCDGYENLEKPRLADYIRARAAIKALASSPLDVPMTLTLLDVPMTLCAHGSVICALCDFIPSTWKPMMS